MQLVGNRNSLSALFLPKLSAEISAERLSVFRRSFGVSAETAIFGRNSHFRQKYHLSADILANYFPETCGIFYRKSLFRQKHPLSVLSVFRQKCFCLKCCLSVIGRKKKFLFRLPTSFHASHRIKQTELRSKCSLKTL